MTRRSPALTVGWREHVDLPDLGIRQIRGKIDTGARTSALHATHLTQYFDEGILMVRFRVRTGGAQGPVRTARAAVVDERTIRSSNGAVEVRPVIETTLSLGGRRWRIEVTLTSRRDMGYHLLLGRQAIRRRVRVDPGRSFLTHDPAEE